MTTFPDCMMPDGAEPCLAFQLLLAHNEELLEGKSLLDELGGALQFILAFYEPGQRYLDTEAWKRAEASGRAAHAKWLALTATARSG